MLARHAAKSRADRERQFVGAPSSFPARTPVTACGWCSLLRPGRCGAIACRVIVGLDAGARLQPTVRATARSTSPSPASHRSQRLWCSACQSNGAVQLSCEMAVNKMGLRFCPGCGELSEASHQACPHCGRSLEGMPVIAVQTASELRGRGSERDPKRAPALADAVPGNRGSSKPYDTDLERRADVPRRASTQAT